MHRSYLQSLGILDPIIKETEFLPETWKIKDRIDFILSETKSKCYCGNYAKPNSKWCGPFCKDKDPKIRCKIGRANKENKVTRSIALKKTLVSRYGVTAVQNIPTIKEKTKVKKQQYYDELTKQTFTAYGLDIDSLSKKEHLEKLCKNSTYKELSEKYFNLMPPMTILRHFNRIGFNPNFEKTSSRGEREISEWLTSLSIFHTRNDRTLIKPKELDIVIPSKNLAIEYNGLYWHSGDSKSHKEKLNLTNQAGYDLIQIFEDEWEMKQDIVKSIISSKLGICDTIYARKTKLSEVDNKTAREFYGKTHIQGYVNGNHFGLFYDDELVSCVTIGKSRFEKNVNELLRFSSKLYTNVVGGFQKLLAGIKPQYQSIATYSDLRYFSGRIYEQCGTYIKTTEPGYFWVDKKGGTRLTRHSTQKHKLKNLLGDSFDKNLTENENMIRNGYLKIWDCGHKKYGL